jgi:hypothetical protein
MSACDTLMNLLGHKSMATSQRYVTAAGTQTRTAAAANPLYRLLNDMTGTQVLPTDPWAVPQVRILPGVLPDLQRCMSAQYLRN